MLYYYEKLMVLYYKILCTNDTFNSILYYGWFIKTTKEREETKWIILVEDYGEF